MSRRMSALRNAPRARFEESSVPSQSFLRTALSAGWRHARAPMGVVLVMVGLVGILVPMVPGVPLLMLGVALLGREHSLIRLLVRWVAWCPGLLRLLRGVGLATVLDPRLAGPATAGTSRWVRWRL
jgi:hypothetical protein